VAHAGFRSKLIEVALLDPCPQHVAATVTAPVEETLLA